MTIKKKRGPKKQVISHGSEHCDARERANRMGFGLALLRQEDTPLDRDRGGHAVRDRWGNIEE